MDSSYGEAVAAMMARVIAMALAAGLVVGGCTTLLATKGCGYRLNVEKVEAPE